MLDPPSNLQIVHVHNNDEKRNDYYFVQNKICQQPILTAAEPSKQSEVLIDACEHPVDKGNVITDTLWNFQR